MKTEIGHQRTIRVYTADSEVRNLGQVLREMVRGARLGLYPGYRLFKKDLRAEHAHSKFGLLWEFVEPLVLGVVFLLLMSVRVVSTAGINIPPAVFVIHGVLLWQTFTDAILIPAEIVNRSKHLVTHTNVAPESLVISIVLRISFYSFFRILIMVGFAVGLGAFSLLGFGKFLLLYPGIVLAGMAFGVALAPINAIYNDVSKVVRISLRPLMYASPVLYAIPPNEILGCVNAISPASTILVNLRSLLTEDLLIDPKRLAITMALLAVLFFFGWIFFRISLPIVAERA